MILRILIASISLFWVGHSVGAERVQLQEIVYNSEYLKYTSDLLEEPKGCLHQSKSQLVACSFRVGRGRKFQLKLDDRVMTVGDNTIMIRETPSRFRLVEGFVRIGPGEPESANATKTVILVSSHSDWKVAARVEGAGEFFVERYGKNVSIVNTGSRKVSLFSSGRDHGWISSGMEVRFARPDRISGEYEIGAPLPLDLESQLVREAKLFEGKKANFAERVDRILALQRGAAELTAKVHSEAVYRKLASLEDAAARRRQEAAKREAEDREIRAMFRRKVLSVE